MKQLDYLAVELENAPCPRCGCAATREILAGEDYLYGVPGMFHVAECTSCGLWYQNPRPTKESLPRLYPESYGPHGPAQQQPAPYADATRRLFSHRVVEAIQWRLARWSPVQHRARAASLTPRLVPAGAILEVGCASGARLVRLRDQGWRHVSGIELVPAAAERARAQGFQVECGMVEDALDAFPDGSFDVVVSSMVLEHLYDPFTVVKMIAAKLKPSGQFLFSTIVRDSLDASLYGRYWAGFDFPRHMVHFTRDDIRQMVAGEFEDVRFIHQVAPVDFVRSSTWRSGCGEGKWLDRVFVVLGESLAARLFNLALAYLGRTTRVSVYCQRKNIPDA